MQKKGKFILMDIAEFENWLKQTTFHRSIGILQNHHTYIPGYTHFKGDNHFKMCEGMESSHLQRGFAEIAQNITTFPDGKIMVCRSLDKIPAGVKGANQNGICMEHIGNFDAGGDTMSQVHKDAIVKINALLLSRFNLPCNTNSIVYHHWYDLNSGKRTNGTGATKSCPGTAFFGGNTVANAQSNFLPLIEAAMKPAAAKAPAILYSAEVTATTLRVRSLPSVDGVVVKSLNKGILIDVYEEKSGWCRIHPTEKHWVSGSFIMKL